MEHGRRWVQQEGVALCSFSRPVPSPPVEARARLSGPRVSSSSGWTSSHSSPGSQPQLKCKKIHREKKHTSDRWLIPDAHVVFSLISLF